MAATVKVALERAKVALERSNRFRSAADPVLTNLFHKQHMFRGASFHAHLILRSTLEEHPAAVLLTPIVGSPHRCEPLRTASLPGRPQQPACTSEDPISPPDFDPAIDSWGYELYCASRAWASMSLSVPQMCTLASVDGQPAWASTTANVHI